MRSVVLGRLLLAYITGILLATYLPFKIIIIVIALILFALSCFIQFYYSQKIKRFTFHWLNGMSLNIIFIFLNTQPSSHPLFLHPQHSSLARIQPSNQHTHPLIYINPASYTLALFTHQSTARSLYRHGRGGRGRRSARDLDKT